MCYCLGCEQISPIDQVKEHLDEKCLIYMCKDVATHCFTAVHYLHEISKLLNEENKIR